MKSPLLLSIVVVNYNSSHQLKECVDALLLETADLKSEVIIVDNASIDGSTDFLHGQGYDRLVTMRNSHPMGYGYAANQGFHASKGKYVLFSNPDMVVMNNTIHNMIKHIEENPCLGAVPGYYLKPDDSLEYFYNTLPTMKGIMVSIIVRHLPIGLGLKFQRLKVYRKYNMTDVEFSGETEVEQPAGAFLLVRKDLFGEECISPEFYLYFTDVDLCRKIYLTNRKIKVYEDCPVYHNHIAKRDFISNIEDNYLYEVDYHISLVNYFRKYHGRWEKMQLKLLVSLVLIGLAVFKALKEVLFETKSFKLFKYRFLILWLFITNRNKLRESRDKIINSKSLVVTTMQHGIES
jgi:GT2 family glycosyltransferase